MFAACAIKPKVMIDRSRTADTFHFGAREISREQFLVRLAGEFQRVPLRAANDVAVLAEEVGDNVEDPRRRAIPHVGRSLSRSAR